MDTKKYHIIINPKSAGGKTKSLQSDIIRRIELIIGKKYTMCFLNNENDAMQITKRVIGNGCENIVVVGGDGTINNTINGFFEGNVMINQNVKLYIINAGTGGGFAQSVGLDSELHHQVQRLDKHQIKKVDIGMISYHKTNGSRHVRYFVNECQIGFGAKLVKDLNPKLKKLGGFWAFGLSALSKSLNYKSHTIELESNSHSFKNRIIGISVLNGAFTGGGMKLAPKASMNDGKLDVLSIKEQSLLKRLTNYPKIYSGNHIKSADFDYFQTEKINFHSAEQIFVASDGDFLGILPCEIQIIPSVINLCL